jgi:hypothetical protein
MTDETTPPDAPRDPGDADPAAEAAGNRETARLRASELRAATRTRDRRRRWGLRLGIVGGIVAVIAVVAIVLVSFARPPAAGPRNMLSDGAKIVGGLAVTRTSGVPVNGDPVPSGDNANGEIAFRMYVDYADPVSTEFLAANAEQLRTWVSEGSATLELHPIARPVSGDGGRFGARAANAVACAAEHSPDRLFEFAMALAAASPAETEVGPDDAEILDLADGAGVTSIDDCVADDDFGRWVEQATSRALNGPLPDTDVEQVTDLPTVLIDGSRFPVADPADTLELARAFRSAAGESFDEGGATPSPTAPAEG